MVGAAHHRPYLFKRKRESDSGRDSLFTASLKDDSQSVLVEVSTCSFASIFRFLKVRTSIF